MLTCRTVIKDIQPRRGQHDFCWREKVIRMTLRMVSMREWSPGKAHGADGAMTSHL